MKPVNKILLLSQLIFFATNNSALSKDKSTQNNQQPLSILKANNISGDQVTNVVTATGNAELTRGNSAVFADKMSYDKNSNVK